MHRDKDKNNFQRNKINLDLNKNKTNWKTLKKKKITDINQLQQKIFILVDNDKKELFFKN